MQNPEKGTRTLTSFVHRARSITVALVYEPTGSEFVRIYCTYRSYKYSSGQELNGRKGLNLVEMDVIQR